MQGAELGETCLMRQHLRHRAESGCGTGADEWDAPGCQPPAINETSLGKHRCHIETDLCIDQVHLSF